jgi:hypothetical protein
MHYSEVAGSKLIRNAALCIPIYTASYHRRPAFSANTGHIHFKCKIVVKPCRLKWCRISTWILRCSFHCLKYSMYIITDILNFFIIFFFHDATAPSGAGSLHCRVFVITFTRHTTIIMTPLEEWSAQRRELYLTIHNTHKRKTSMPLKWFKPEIPAS